MCFLNGVDHFLTTHIKFNDPVAFVNRGYLLQTLLLTVVTLTSAAWKLKIGVGWINE
jgi:hypothetical protein